MGSWGCVGSVSNLGRNRGFGRLFGSKRAGVGDARGHLLGGKSILPDSAGNTPIGRPSSWLVWQKPTQRLFGEVNAATSAYTDEAGRIP